MKCDVPGVEVEIPFRIASSSRREGNALRLCDSYKVRYDLTLPHSSAWLTSSAHLKRTPLYTPSKHSKRQWFPSKPVS
jgi:hypothetical protein